MEKFFQSLAVRITGGLLLIVIGAIGTATFKVYFPSSEYVNQQVDNSAAKIRAEMQIADHELRERQIVQSESFQAAVEEFVKNNNETKQSFISLQKDMDYVKVGISDLKADSKELKDRVRQVEVKVGK